MTGPAPRPVVSVVGKGGVGKTAVSSLLGRALLETGARPLLLIDADPAGGLVSAIGETVDLTLAQARYKLIAQARGADARTKSELASNLDYMVMESLVERSGYALLAMGRMEEKGCFCPANTLLRQAIDLVVEPFAFVLIDAEAGLEQISRQVTRRVTLVVAVSDGSARSADTIGHIQGMVEAERLAVVGNRVDAADDLGLPEGVRLLGTVPEDATVRRFDRAGRPLWELPEDNAALAAARAIAEKLCTPGP